jgi:acylphosphatase
MANLERRRIYFSGRVQGVGFRYTTERLAKGFDVAGTVRNLPDGRVELLVEGEWPVISQFLTSIVTQLEPYIHDVSSETEPLDEQLLTDFRIVS